MPSGDARGPLPASGSRGAVEGSRVVDRGGAGSRPRLGSWFAYLALGLPAVIGYFLLPTGSAAQGTLYDLFGASAVAAALLGVRRWRPGRPSAWYLLALGLSALVIGDVIFNVYENALGVEAPFPSLADASYLIGYPLICLGLLSMVRSRTPRRDRTALLDTAIIATGLGVLSYVFLMSPYLEDPSLPVAERLISAAYPFMDVLMLAVATRLAFTTKLRSAANYLLFLAVALYLAADTVYAGEILAGVYASGRSVDAGWLLSYLLFGATALHPSMRSLTERAPVGEMRHTRLRLATLVATTLALPLTLVFRELDRPDGSSLVMIVGTVVLFVLVLLRMDGLVQFAEAASRRYERAASRERVLRGAGARLVAALDREEIHRVALDTILELTDGEGEVRASVVAGPPRELAVVAARGSDGSPYGEADEISGASFDARELPEPLRRGFVQEGLVEARGPDIAGVPQKMEILGLGPKTGAVLVSPLAGGDRGEVAGALVAATDAHFPVEFRDGFVALGSQVSLALESMALSEDLHRRRGEARFRSLIQNSSDMITVVDECGADLYQSPSVGWILGRDPEVGEGAPYSELVHAEDLARHSEAIEEATRNPGATVTAEVRMLHRDGSWRHMESAFRSLLDDPNVGGVVINARDITERKSLEEELARRALHDSLTGLPNRALFADRLGQALARKVRGEGSVTVLFLDLDDFKTVNDSLGHAAGDRLLVEVAGRLSSCARLEDTVARLGGDEFAMLIEDSPALETEALVADRVLGALQAPVLLGGKEVFVHASVGIAQGSAGELAEDILRNADAAMYAAKGRGKGRYEFYDPGMHAAALERLQLRADLRRAVEHEEFVVHYQPIVALSGPEEIRGFEALVRWEHPEKGLLPPVKFIPLAEETGLIVEIGLLVLDAACRQVKRWQDSRPDLGPIALNVNLSAKQFQRADLAEQVSAVLLETGFAADSLKLEVTESVAMEDVDLALVTIRRLKDLGIRVAIDDFGTGYSSLSYLRRFPVNDLKIDRSFVGRLEEDPESAAIVSTTVSLARILGLTVTAEGVETAGQLARLREMGCDLAQGYHLSKPLPAQAASALLALPDLRH